MIPKRAFFFWEGGPMSWLRTQSLYTFRALNPGWEVELLDGSDLPIQGDTLLSRVHRSDWKRYRALHQKGGFYFDTDIIFVRPIPEEWRNHDMVLSMFGEHEDHVAVMASQPGEQFFRSADRICEHMVASGRVLSYQALGVLILPQIKAQIVCRDIKWVEASTFLPFSYVHTEKLWNPSATGVAPLTVGVHWFGGDHLSLAMEPYCGEQWASESNCFLARAWREFRAKALGIPTSDYSSSVHESIVEFIRYETAGTDTVLDLGAGRFNYTAIALSKRKVGMDIWPEHVRIYTGDGVETVLGDMRSYRKSFADPFDCAMLIDSLEHVSHEDGEALLRSLQNDCGKILVFTPSGFHQQDSDLWGHDNPHQRHECGWTKAELEALGFSVREDVGFHSQNKEGERDALFAVWKRDA